MISTAGPKPRRNEDHALPVRIGTALISTLWPIRKDSSPGSTKAGSVVMKVRAGRAADAADAAVPGASVDAERSVDAQQEEAIAAALAQAYCSDAAVLAAEECVQLHGGIGFTWEHPAHLYLKRAKSSAIALGTPDRQRAALARMVDVPAA